MRLSSQSSQFIFNLPSDFLRTETINTYQPILEKNWVQYDNVIDYLNSTINGVVSFALSLIIRELPDPSWRILTVSVVLFA